MFDKVRNKIPLDITLSVDQILTELAAKSLDSLPGHLLQKQLYTEKTSDSTNISLAKVFIYLNNTKENIVNHE